MPRPLRVHLEGALYVVTSRALAQRRLFRDDQDYCAYLELLAAYQEQYGFRLFAYALLPDHLYLCLEPNASRTVSQIMHDLNSRYTKYFAKRYGHSGHVFEERFKSTVAEKSTSLLPLTAYLHTYPRRMGVAPDERTYAWSSLGQYLNLTTGEAGPVLRAEVAEVADLIARDGLSGYRQYLERVTPAECERLQAELAKSAVGSEPFLALVRQRRNAMRRPTAEPSRPIPSPQPAPRPHRQGMPLTVTISSAVAILAVSVAALAATNLKTLRQTVQILAQERTLGQPGPGTPASAPSGQPGTRLATLLQPSTLNGTVWELQVKPLYASGQTVAQADQVRFEGGQVISTRLSREGFADSNYTLSVQPSGSVSWETMQTGAGGEVVCWRGEWDGRQTMRGVLTRQKPGRATEEYGFVGVAKGRQGGEQAASAQEI